MLSPSRNGGRCRLIALFFAAALLLLTFVPADAAAQIPDTFDNLQVLPADIQRRALVGVMRGLAGSLGVQCDHCHVGGDPNTLEGFDFASDDKETKRVGCAIFRARLAAVSGSSSCATPSNTQSPGPIAPTSESATLTRASRTR